MARPVRARLALPRVAHKRASYQQRSGASSRGASVLFKAFNEAPQFIEDWLVIEQPLGNDWSSGRQGVRLAIGEEGLILLDTNVTGRVPRRCR